MTRINCEQGVRVVDTPKRLPGGVVAAALETYCQEKCQEKCMARFGDDLTTVRKGVKEILKSASDGLPVDE